MFGTIVGIFAGRANQSSAVSALAWAGSNRLHYYKACKQLETNKDTAIVHFSFLGVTQTYKNTSHSLKGVVISLGNIFVQYEATPKPKIHVASYIGTQRLQHIINTCLSIKFSRRILRKN